jgi:hypothetical protein
MGSEKEQMISSFQLTLTTYSAGIVLHEKILPLQHGSYV